MLRRVTLQRNVLRTARNSRVSEFCGRPGWQVGPRRLPPPGRRRLQKLPLR